MEVVPLRTAFHEYKLNNSDGGYKIMVRFVGAVRLQIWGCTPINMGLYAHPQPSFKPNRAWNRAFMEHYMEHRIKHSCSHHIRTLRMI